jgi:hypothetical protein
MTLVLGDAMIHSRAVLVYNGYAEQYRKILLRPKRLTQDF